MFGQNNPNNCVKNQFSLHLTEFKKWQICGHLICQWQRANAIQDQLIINIFDNLKI